MNSRTECAHIKKNTNSKDQNLFLLNQAQIPEKLLSRRITWQKKAHVLTDRRLKPCEIAETVTTRQRRPYSAWNIGHDQWVPRLLTADIKRNRETTSQQLFVAVWCGMRRSFCIASWPPMKYGSTGTHHAVHFSRRICSEEGEDCPIDRKGDGLRFLEFTRYDLGWLPEKTQTSQKALSSMANYWAGSTSNSKVNGFIWRGKSAVSPRVHTGSHLRRLKIKLVELSYELLTHRPHSLALLGQVYWAEYLSKRFCFFLLF